MTWSWVARDSASLEHEKAGASTQHVVDRRAPDMRLVPAALATWLMTALSLRWSPIRTFVVVAILLPCALACWKFCGVWRGSLVLALGCAVCAGAATGVRVGMRDASPLSELADRRATVRAHIVINDDPKLLRSTQNARGGPRIAVSATVREARANDDTWLLSDDVIVIAPAESWQHLVPSQRVSVDGQLAPARGHGLMVATLFADRGPDEVSSPSAIHEAAAAIRSGLREAVSDYPRDVRGLLPGLVLGDTSELDFATAEDFRAVGLTHLLAVSGSNCTIIVGSVLVLLRGRLDSRLCAVAAGVALIGFVIVVRPSPSVLRAAVMGSVALFAMITGRPRTAVPALATTIIILVLSVPELATDAGFMLSVAGTASIVLIAPVLVARLHAVGVPQGLAEMVAVCAAAYVATAPIVAGLSGQVSLIAIAANILASPAVPLVTVLGLLAALTAPLSLWLAGCFVWLAALPTQWLLFIARRGSTLPLATLSWPSGIVGVCLAVGTLLGIVLVVRYRAVRYGACACLVGIAAVFFSVRGTSSLWPPGNWWFVACDVGQGDALVVRIAADTAVLVDAGPDPAAVDQCLRRLSIHQIPLIVLTHLHIDHVGGLEGVLRGRAVAEIAIGPLEEPIYALREVRRLAAERGIRLVRPVLGEVRQSHGVRIEVLSPRVAFRATRSDPNNSSFVLRVTFHGHRMLLTGDVEVEAQRALLDKDVDLHAEVLKVPHHGSAFSDDGFLAATQARVAIVSVGAQNDYGHPAAGLMSQLRRLGMRVYRTDQDGDIAVSEQKGRLTVTGRSRGPPDLVAALCDPQAQYRPRRVRMGKWLIRPRAPRSSHS